MEIWRNIEEYPGYQVSNLGNVKSFKKGRIKLLKQHINMWGYSKVGLCRDCVYKEYGVSRLVARAFPDICGEWFDECDVDHINTIRTDNRAENLRVCSHKENCNNPITLHKNATSHIGNKSRTGQTASIETRMKMSEAHKGKTTWTIGKHWKLVDGKRIWY